MRMRGMTRERWPLPDCPHGRPNGMLCKFGCQERMAKERDAARAVESVPPIVITDEQRAEYEKRKWATRYRKNKLGR